MRARETKTNKKDLLLTDQSYVLTMSKICRCNKEYDKVED